MKSDNYIVRKGVCTGIGKLHFDHERAVDLALERLLNDDDRWVREEAAEALVRVAAHSNKKVMKSVESVLEIADKRRVVALAVNKLLVMRQHLKKNNNSERKDQPKEDK